MSGPWSPWRVPVTPRAGPLGHDPAQLQRWWGQLAGPVQRTKDSLTGGGPWAAVRRGWRLEPAKAVPPGGVRIRAAPGAVEREGG